MENTISAVIITQNEERNIARCLDSLSGVADEVVVVDSGSTDRTEELCTVRNARFFHHAWAGYSGQKNYAEGLAVGGWVLSIDADEALSPELRESLLRLKADGLKAGTVYSVCRLSNYCGNWIRHSGWYPDEKVRLWTRGACSWEGVVHEKLCFRQPVERVRLQGDLLHYTYYSVGDHAARQVKYARLAAEKAYAQQRRCPTGALWFKPGWTFFRNYVLKGGFLDGRAGFLVCRMSAFYTLVKYARLRELQGETR